MGSDVEVTEADREKAAEVVEKIAGVPWDVFSDAEWVWVGHVAQALAEERAKAYREGYVDADNGRDPKW